MATDLRRDLGTPAAPESVSLVIITFRPRVSSRCLWVASPPHRAPKPRSVCLGQPKRAHRPNPPHLLHRCGSRHERLSESLPGKRAKEARFPNHPAVLANRNQSDRAALRLFAPRRLGRRPAITGRKKAPIAQPAARLNSLRPLPRPNRRLLPSQCRRSHRLRATPSHCRQVLSRNLRA